MAGELKEERLKRYRQYAVESLAMAAKAEPIYAWFYLQLAEQWLKLAQTIERKTAVAKN